MSWAAQKLQVRVRGRDREIEVSLPGGRPVGSLLPGLVAICEGVDPDAATTSGWRLVNDEGRELSLAGTLLGAGVSDGASLRLRPPGREVETPGERRRRLDQAIRSNSISPGLTVAVASPKGGVGKTTIALLLGTLLARARSDWVIAIDADPDYGTLGRTLRAGRPMFVDELADLADQPALTSAMLDRHLARGPEGLIVVPAPVDPLHMDNLDETAYRKVIPFVARLAPIVVVDCGAGMRSAATRAAVDLADQLVLVTDAEPPTVSLVGEAARVLARDRPYALVVNKVPRTGIDRHRIVDVVPGARALVEVAAHPELARRLTAGDLPWDAMPPGWHGAARDLAAGLIAGWEATAAGVN